MLQRGKNVVENRISALSFAVHPSVFYRHERAEPPCVGRSATSDYFVSAFDLRRGPK